MSIFAVIQRTYICDETVESIMDFNDTIDGFCNIVKPAGHEGAKDIYVAALRHDGSWDYVLIYTVDEEHKNFRIGVQSEAFTDFDHAYVAFRKAAEEAFKKGFLVRWCEYEAPDEE